jgi:hypothetical protein
MPDLRDAHASASQIDPALLAKRIGEAKDLVSRNRCNFYIVLAIVEGKERLRIISARDIKPEHDILHCEEWSK